MTDELEKPKAVYTQKSFSKLLVDARKAKKMTQGELGEKLNVCGQFVSNWERSMSMPPHSYIPAISKILEVNAGDVKCSLVRFEVERILKRYNFVLVGGEFRPRSKAKT